MKPLSLAQIGRTTPAEDRALWDQLNAQQGALFLAANGFERGEPQTPEYQDIIRRMNALNPVGFGYWGQRDPGTVLALDPVSGHYKDPGPDVGVRPPSLAKMGTR